MMVTVELMQNLGLGIEETISDPISKAMADSIGKMRSRGKEDSALIGS